MNVDAASLVGIESSCDETACAVVAGGREILSSVVASQDDLHAAFRGVVPEIASRAHLERLNIIVSQALSSAGVSFAEISAIAAVNRPGLVGSLLIGFTAAKTYAWALSKPLISVNHLHAHAYGALMGCEDWSFPAVALIVSGGHTSLFYCRSPLDLQQVGYTQDDAAGEAFDKVATVLDLPYPGGPVIDELAKTGDPEAVKFPRTWLAKGSLNFSFSGLKTAVLYHVRGTTLTRPDSSHLSDQQRADIAASFQAAVVDVLVGKSIEASRRHRTDTLLVGGGVASNSCLRRRMTQRCGSDGIRLVLADPQLCTDNAAMVAGLGWHKYQAGDFCGLDEQVFSSCPVRMQWRTDRSVLELMSC